MRLAEETILLLLDEEGGGLRPVPERTLNLALAGAVLMDLQLADRIDTDLDSVILLDSTPLGDDLLDPTLADIAASDRPQDVYSWLQREAEAGSEIRESAIARLVERGILQEPQDGFLALVPGVARTRRYPHARGGRGQLVTLRIMRLLFDDDIPDPNDVAIVCLANACGLFAALLTKPELREVQARIDLISRMDLIGQAIVKVVRLAMPVFRDEEARALTEALPAAPGLPVIGNTLEAARDLLGLLERQYRALGPIFRIRVATADNTFLAGREANLFLLRKERFFLRASETLGNNCRALGSSRVVVGMDGGDHVRMRRALQGGISRDLFQSRLTEVVRIIRRQMAEWPQNVSPPGYLALQRLIVNQAGALSAGTLPGECLDDMVYLVDEILHDGFTPHMRNKVRFGKSRRRVEEFAGKLIASHQLHRRKREPDLVDDLIDLHRADPGFLAGVDLSLAALTPFLFATHTSSAVTAFIVYTLAKSPELKARVRGGSRGAVRRRGRDRSENARALMSSPGWSWKHCACVRWCRSCSAGSPRRLNSPDTGSPRAASSISPCR